MVDIQTLINKIITTQKSAVLAQIIDVEGSVNHKPGTGKLFIEGNTPISMMSESFLENRLHNRSERLFNTGQTEIISYDFSLENEHESVLGKEKNGTVHVLLRDIDHNFRKTLTSVRDTLSENEPVLYIQSMKDFSQYIFSYEQEDTFGFWDSNTDWEWIDAKPTQNIVGQRDFGNQQYFIQLIWP